MKEERDLRRKKKKGRVQGKAKFPIGWRHFNLRSWEVLWREEVEERLGGEISTDLGRENISWKKDTKQWMDWTTERMFPLPWLFYPHIVFPYWNEADNCMLLRVKGIHHNCEIRSHSWIELKEWQKFDSRREQNNFTQSVWGNDKEWNQK